MLEALSFLTIIGRGRKPSPAAVAWFPVVGTALGAAVGLAYWGASQWWNPAVAGLLAVAADLALTGMLHLDGLADAADGLLPHMDRERRLAVMSTPDIGAFAVGIVSVTLIARVVSISSLEPGVRTTIGLSALWGTSRLVMAGALTHLTYARPGGLAQSFRGALRRNVQGLWLVVWIAAFVALGMWDHSGRWPAAAAAAVAAGAGVLWVSQRRIQGFTGDALGAACLLSETMGLLVASANW